MPLYDDMSMNFQHVLKGVSINNNCTTSLFEVV